MNRFIVAFACLLPFGVSAGVASVAWAQDAGTSPSQSQTTSPSQSDTSSPLTPTNPTTSTPLTPTPTNPVGGQSQQTGASAVQSSSEVPSTFVQPPVELNRVDPSAPSSLQLLIDPAGVQASLLSPDVTQLAPTTAGASLNSVQGTTPLPSPLGSSTRSSTASISYPAKIAEPASTQAFLSALGGGSGGGSASMSTSRTGSSTSMGPLIGSAALQNSMSVAPMSSGPTQVGASSFMRAPTATSAIVSPIASTSASIGPSALRTFNRGSSSLGHRAMTSSHH